MLDRIYHVTAHGVMDLVMVQVTLVIIDDGHAHEVGSREVYVSAPEAETGVSDLRVIARALDAMAKDMIS